MRRLCALVVLVGIAACGSDSPTPPASPASVGSATGSGQTATVGQLLGAALSVVVRDDGGQPFAGATVQWAVAAGGGTVSPTSSQTDADGVATTQWTLGGTAGQQSVTATVSGLSPVSFTATAEAGPPTQVVLTPAGPGITALGGTAQLSASVQDAFGNALAGETVEWASADEAIVTVDASGLATGVAVGSADVSATVTGSSTAGSTAVTVSQVPASVTVDVGAGQVLIGASLQASAEVRDANDHVIPSPSIAWSSDDEAILTVDGSGMVTGVAAGITDVVATSGAVSGSGPVEVIFQPPNFEPTADAAIDGDAVFDDVTIPAGVTVTITADATITVLGNMDIDGTVIGDCVKMEFLGQGAATYDGTFDNSCAAEPDGDGPDMILVNNGPLTITGASFTYEGNLEIKNDPTLVDDDSFLSSPAPVAGAAQLGNLCLVHGGTFIPARPVARSGDFGNTFGTDGRDARKVALTCSGDLVLQGGSRVDAREGGQGGDAGHPNPPSNNSTGRGGDGGDGGDLNVRARGDLTFGNTGGGSVLNLASGGRGGDATVPGRFPGGNAEAEGGDGGDGGNMRVEARGAIFIDPGGLTINVGDGGRGGHATATGGDGMDAGVAAATMGGTGDATGGDGGDSVDGRLRATGGVFGEASIVLTGGDGGVGGNSTTSGGNGGKGNDMFPDGAAGGDIVIDGGMGGLARTRDITGTTIGTSGNGGDAFVSQAMGGLGKNRCHLPMAGGMGGEGGMASGPAGTAGMGDNPGLPGVINVAAGTGDGGNGGDGLPIGIGGVARGDAMVGQENQAGPAFENGDDGNPCKANVQIAVTSDPNGHEPFVMLTGVNQLEFTLEGNTLLMTGNGVFPDMTGTIDEAGNFTLMGAGTLAGFPNVDVIFTGTISNGMITGVLTADADNNQFPADPDTMERHPPVYSVNGTVPPPDPVP